MPFPASPTDGDFHVEDGIRRRWVAADSTWVKDQPGRDVGTGHIQAEAAAELRDFGYPKVADVAALPTLPVERVGTIYTTSDDGHNHVMVAVDSWRDITLFTRFGATGAGGTLDFNDATNAAHGSGASLLNGTTAANAPVPGANAFWHTFSYEFGATEDGTGNLTQYAIPYANQASLDTGMWMRGRLGGTWTPWTRVDAGILPDRGYEYLTSIGGAINPAITDDIARGKLVLGTQVHVSERYLSRGNGAAVYKLVAAGTGTYDGGSYVPVDANFELEAKFNGEVDIAQFGAVMSNASIPLSVQFGSLAAAQAVYPHATALTDEVDWAAFQSAANWCIANNAKLISTGFVGFINQTVNMRGVQDFDLRSTFEIIHTTGPGIVVGGDSTNRLPIRGSIERAVHNGGPRLGDTNNPAVRVMGVKNADIDIGYVDYFQVYADDASAATDSSAYSKFKIGYTEFLELRGVGVGWINENTFDCGDVTRVDIVGDSFAHNNNIIRDPSLEGGTVNIVNAHSNAIEGVRAEAGIVVNFDALSSRNTVEISWHTNPTFVDGVESGLINVTDVSDRNSVYHRFANRSQSISVLRIDRHTKAIDAANELPSPASLIQPGLDKVLSPVAGASYADTGLLRVRSNLEPTLGHRSRVIDFLFNSDVAMWRLKTYVYDSDGVPLDGAGTDYIALVGGWVWNAAGYYEFVADVSTARIHIQSTAVSFIRFLFDTGPSSAGVWFEYAELGAYFEAPVTPGLQAEYQRQLDPANLQQASSPTKSLLPLGHRLSVAGVDTEVSFRLQSVTTAAQVATDTTVDVESVVGIAAGDLVAVLVSANETHFSTVASVGGLTITLNDPLPSAVASSAPIVVSRITPVAAPSTVDTSNTGNGVATSFGPINHALNTTTPTVHVFVAGVLISDGWSATITDANNIQVDFGVAPANLAAITVKVEV